MQNPLLLQFHGPAAVEEDNPILESSLHEFPHPFDLQRAVIQENLSGLAVEGEIENPVPPHAPGQHKVVEELLRHIRGEVDGFDPVRVRRELDQREDALPVLDLEIPMRFQANDILFITFAPNHFGSAFMGSNPAKVERKPRSVFGGELSLLQSSPKI